MSYKTLEKILYAEDEDDIKTIVQIALEEVGGFKVKFCSNGREVLTEAKLFLPDLILLDVMMPEMDGPTTLQELRKIPECKHIPIVFMTAKIQPDELKDYKANGVIDVINKPFDPMHLAERLQTIWKKYHGAVS